jgi:hypothetical protein
MKINFGELINQHGFARAVILAFPNVPPDVLKNCTFSQLVQIIIDMPRVPMVEKLFNRLISSTDKSELENLSGIVLARFNSTEIDISALVVTFNRVGSKAAEIIMYKAIKIGGAVAARQILSLFDNDVEAVNRAMIKFLMIAETSDDFVAVLKQAKKGSTAQQMALATLGRRGRRYYNLTRGCIGRTDYDSDLLEIAADQAQSLEQLNEVLELTLKQTNPSAADLVIIKLRQLLSDRVPEAV